MKKQIAVLMAAATAVTTVAPVLASADVNTYALSISQVNDKIKAALNEKYKNKNEDGVHLSNGNNVDEYMNSKYVVAVVAKDSADLVKGYDVAAIADTGYKASPDAEKNDLIKKDLLAAANKGNKEAFGDGDIYIVKDATRTQGLIEKLTFAKKAFRVVVLDKGAKDGNAVEALTNKHFVVSENDVSGEEAKTSFSLNTFAKDLVKNLKTDVKDGFVKSVKINEDVEVKTEGEVNVEVTKIKFTLTSGKEFTVEANDQVFDLTKPLADKTPINLGGNNSQEVLDGITGFEYLKNDDDKKFNVLIPLGNASVYSVENVVSETIDLGKIFTKKGGYTKEGADFVNAIVDAKKAQTEGKGNVNFNFRNVHYSFNNVVESKIDKAADGKGYVLKYTVNVNDLTNGYNDVNVQFLIKGDDQNDLSIVSGSLPTATTAGNNVVEGYFTRLIGSNRYETAVSVSKEVFKDGKKADTVVIVGGEALMDGLSAVPLAKSKNAPILLANPKSGLSDETINEIKRAVGDSLYRKNVYIVGGENSVPAVTVKQLEKLGVTVTRLSGSDRFATSLEVAQNIELDSTAANRKVFLVGGEGAADAMSVSPVAASGDKVSPIVVVPKAGLNKSTRKYLNDNFKDGKAYLIGGEASLSTNVYRGLDSVDNKNRIAGKDRYDTNVLLVKEFYQKGAAGDNIEVKGAIFTSGDNKFLVDAQTAGPLAAIEQAPIVLAGSKLTDDQVKLLNKDAQLGGLKSNVFQVGGALSSDVMSVVVDKLGL